MNPLAAYLLSVVKNEKTNDTFTYLDNQASLSELGIGCWRDRPVTLASRCRRAR